MAAIIAICGTHGHIQTYFARKEKGGIDRRKQDPIIGAYNM